MPTLTITRARVCAGGGHTDLSGSIDDGKPIIVHVDTDALRVPLDEEEVKQLIVLAARMKNAAKSRAEVSTGLRDPITVTV